MPRSRLPLAEPASRLDRDPPIDHRVADVDPLAAEALDGLRPPPAPGPGERLADLVARSGRSPRQLLVVAMAVVVAAAVGWWLLRPPAAPVEASLPLASSAGGGAASSTTAAEGSSSTGASAASTTTPADDLVVQAAGAVARDGVYRLPAGSRVDDLVRAAGGLAPDADRDRVNLAAPLADGERVWVPRAGQVDVPEVVAGSGAGPGTSVAEGGATAGPGAGPPAVVDLNTATAAELDTLPGVGPATAAAILAYRDEHGRFASVDELLEVRGIGEAKLDQLRSVVTV
ncbi:MAG: helix-hairpin-helix domain-containing protein [Acidimicrobiales bacterium]